jgi:hypothetical protein
VLRQCSFHWQRAEFQDTVKPLAPDSFVFLDEAGCHQAMTRLYACAPRDQRAQATKPVNRGRHVTILGALSLNGKVKALLRAKAARTLEALEQAIAEALAAITSQDAHGWFAHAGYCVVSN